MNLRVALAQINSTVGDVVGNADRILESIDRARDAGADLVVFPEQAVSGYPAEDLLLKPQFLRANKKQLDRIAKGTKGICALVGFPEAQDKHVFNSAGICVDGRLAAIYRKMRLPNYEVFDEVRYFVPGAQPMVLNLAGRRIGISVCEDIWVSGSPETDEVYGGDAQCIVNLSASPFFSDKPANRANMMAGRAKELGAYVVFCNLAGGQDELVFDGNSAVFGPHGDLIAHAKSFDEDLLVVDLELFNSVSKSAPSDELPLKPVRVVEAENLNIKMEKPINANRIESRLQGAEEIYKALCTGCRDYIRKNGFTKVVLGLSGGVDSAISATVAADALGPENVLTLFMPSRFTSEESRTDAFALAKNLKIKCITVPIDPAMEAYQQVLAPHFEGMKEDTTEENIQARIRGNYLMAFSNKFGYLVLSTGNKSENSVGYATLYGDMSGGFNIIKDVPKVMIYALCEYRNSLDENPVFPENILSKAPTAELRPGQKDTDSLPPYDLLDPILKLYVEQDHSFDQIVKAGYDPNLVSKIIRLVDRSEYKRRQSCPGIKITPRAFGKDRRLPITNRYRDGK